MKKRKRVLNGMLTLFLTSVFMYSVGFAGDAPRITKEKAKDLSGGPDVLILDARTGAAWAYSNTKIKGAVRVDPSNVDSWAGTLPKDKTIIIYCS
jgi:rhodanese-related sulfurtransferase